MTYNAQYKCRLCNAVLVCKQGLENPSYARINMFANKEDVVLVSSHDCKNGNVGICDLQGFIAGGDNNCM